MSSSTTSTFTAASGTVVTTHTAAGTPPTVTVAPGTGTGTAAGMLALSGGLAAADSQTAGALSVVGGLASHGTTSHGGDVSVVGGTCSLGTGGDVTIRAESAASSGVELHSGASGSALILVPASASSATLVASGIVSVSGAPLIGMAPSIQVKAAGTLVVQSDTDLVSIDSPVGVLLTTDDNGGGTAASTTINPGTTTGAFDGADVAVAGGDTTGITSIGGDALISGGTGGSVGGAVSFVGGAGGSGTFTGSSITLKVCGEMYSFRFLA